MQVETKLNTVKGNLCKCKQSLAHSDATSIDTALYHAVAELTEICELLSSGIDELTAKNAQLAAQCERNAQIG